MASSSVPFSFPGGEQPEDMPDAMFREVGHRIVDRIARYLEEGPEAPVLTRIEPGSILDQLPHSAPEEPESPDRILEDFEQILYPGLTHWNSPRYMAYFPSVASAPGILGEMLAAGFGQNSMLWRTGPAATELEVRVMEWLRELLGLPSEFFGHIVDTASTASLLSLAASRERHPDLKLRSEGLAGRPEVPRLAIYASQEAHASIDKAAMTLGFGLEQVRKIASDDLFQMRPDVLREAIQRDRDSGVLPLAVVATVGTTSSTSIDPVPRIADICEEFGVWLHVDAAYGGVAAIVPDKRHILAGCDRADSVVVNPHKWLFTPLDLSALYVRRPAEFKAAFCLMPEYITSDLDHDERLINLMDYGFQMGRRWRSLKLWMVLRYYGAEGIRQRLAWHMELAGHLSTVIDEQPGVELVAPVNFATVCFRFRPEGWPAGTDESEAGLERLNAEVMRRANAGGEVFLSHTKLRGVYTLRLAIGHIRTGAEDMKVVWQLLTRLADEVATDHQVG
jgi:aromatic-L-amino-acid decarboxylase